VAEAPPLSPRPLDQDSLLGLFKGDAVGRDVVLQPATLEDMAGPQALKKRSLEVIYDASV
jgi:chlorophyllide a reductase subunit X